MLMPNRSLITDAGRSAASEMRAALRACCTRRPLSFIFLAKDAGDMCPATPRPGKSQAGRPEPGAIRGTPRCSDAAGRLARISASGGGKRMTGPFVLMEKPSGTGDLPMLSMWICALVSFTMRSSWTP